MRRRIQATFALLCLSAPMLCSLAWASSVTVPDDYPTVQIAVSSGADTVRIRSGTYPERPLIDHPVVLEGIGEERPSLAGLEITNFNFFQTPRQLSVRQLHFLGRVNHTTVAESPRLLVVSFTECSLDSGFNQVVSLDSYDIESLNFKDSHLRHQSQARTAFVTMARDTVDGGVSWDTDGNVSITDCVFTGNGSGIALELPYQPSGHILRNYVDNYGTGIAASDMHSAVVAHNVIARCDVGLRLSNSGEPIEVTDNDVRACGAGIVVGAGRTFYLRRNTVLGSSRTGIEARVTGIEAEDNVVGWSGADGILLAHVEDPIVRGNTVFRNNGSGIAVSSVTIGGLVVENNISFENQAWGLVVPGDQTTALRCNDWYGNALGTVNGASPDPSDLNVDPLFCNVDSADVRLMTKSPVADASGCGRIGAGEVGCGVTATLFEYLHVEQSGTGAVVRWRFGFAEPMQCWLERSSHEKTGWHRLPGHPETEGDQFWQRDADLEVGRPYWYRVGWQRGEVIGYSDILAFGLNALPPQSRISPNPSRGPIQVSWSQPIGADVDVRVYDLAGREMSRLTRGRYELGNHSLAWDGRRAGGEPLAAGWYVLRLRGGINAAHMVLILR